MLTLNKILKGFRKTKKQLERFRNQSLKQLDTLQNAREDLDAKIDATDREHVKAERVLHEVNRLLGEED